MKAIYFAAQFLLLITGLSASQPNILMIAIDDLKPTLGSMGDKLAVTPHMDRLASEGLTFQKAYCQQAICDPSRASVMAGQYPDQTGVKDLKTLMRKVSPNIVTIPQHFKSHGYNTAATGKIFDPRNVDNGHDSVSWSIPYTAPHRRERSRWP